MEQEYSPHIHIWSCLHSKSSLPRYTPDDPGHSPHPGLQSVQNQRLLNKNLESVARKEPTLLAWTSPVLGGDSTEVKRWRPRRPGHLGAIWELEPGKEEQLWPPSPPMADASPGLVSFSTTSSSIIHTHAAVLWLVQAPWVWMSFFCGSSRMKLEMTISALTEEQTWRIQIWLQHSSIVFNWACVDSGKLKLLEVHDISDFNKPFKLSFRRFLEWSSSPFLNSG